MEIKDIKKLLKGLTEENITFDEPHVTHRCQENNLKKKSIIHTLLKDYNNLVKIIEDRPSTIKCIKRGSTMEKIKSSFYFDYSSNSDILNIHKKDKLVKGSAELGDFTIDFDSSNNIVGVEIMNASEFLKDIEITKEQLINMEDAKFLVNQRDPDYTYVLVCLLLPNKVEKRVPIPAPVARSRFHSF